MMIKALSTPAIDTDRSWLEFDLENLKHNAVALQAAMPDGCELMAVVKADAYGHGAMIVSTCLSEIGIKAFAVATIDEGIRLRRNGIKGEILVMGYTSPLRAKELQKYHLMQTLIDFKYATALDQMGYDINTHIKIDTGMHRLGLNVDDVCDVAQIFQLIHLKVSGIYTHLCVSDSINTEDNAFTYRQIKDFYHLLKTLVMEDIKLPKIHIQSSYGLLNYPKLRCDYARIGIALYGSSTTLGDQTNLRIDLRPVLSLKSQVVLIREIKHGDSVGYSKAFTAKRDSRIAILPIGYADGLPRNLSCGNGDVLIHGRRVPIIGRICMDQLVVDITDVPDVNIGDIATLIGKDGLAEISAAEVAQKSGSITNELLCRMGKRLRRKYIYYKC